MAPEGMSPAVTDWTSFLQFLMQSGIGGRHLPEPNFESQFLSPRPAFTGSHDVKVGHRTVKQGMYNPPIHFKCVAAAARHKALGLYAVDFL